MLLTKVSVWAWTVGVECRRMLMRCVCCGLGVDFVQEKFLGAGDQSNESAIEQAKDEQISDFIRGKYKSTTGNDFPVQDKQ